MHWHIERVNQTTSTNDDIKQAAEQGADTGLVICALRQSAGRGRQGRSWQSPEGNLYFSVLLKPTTERRDWGQYSFVCALAIADAITHFLPQTQIELKWPNDVLVTGKKISGILLEAGEDYLVAGMGINAAVAPENPLYPATSITEQGANVALEDLLNRILTGLDHWQSQLEQQGFAPVRAAWLARARKGPMLARLPKEAIRGQFADLDENGNLQLALPDGSRKTVLSGDIFF